MSSKDPDQLRRELVHRWTAQRAAEPTWTDFFARADALGVPRMEAIWLRDRFVGATRDEDDVAGATRALPQLAARRRQWTVRHHCGQPITIRDHITTRTYYVGGREVVTCPSCSYPLGSDYMLREDDIWDRLPADLKRTYEEAIMPVIGVTTGERRPRAIQLGKFKKGGEKETRTRDDGSEYQIWGKDLPNYFRYVEKVPGTAEAIREIFGDRPNHIEVLFPYPDAVDGNWMAFKEKWDASRLIHRCDGHWIWDYDDYGELVRTGRPCPYGPEAEGPPPDDDPCELIGRLAAIVPDLLQAGFYGHVTFETTSLYDLEAVDAQMHDYLDKFGFGLGVRYIVGREWREVTTGRPNGKKVREEKSLLYVMAEREFVQYRLQAAREQKLLEVRGASAAPQLTAGAPAGDGPAGEVEVDVIDAPAGDETDEALDAPGSPGEPPASNGNGNSSWPARPWDASTLRRYIRKRAGELGDPPDSKPPGSRRGGAVAALKDVVDEPDPDQREAKRRMLTDYFFGKYSTSEFTAGEVEAVIKWVGATKDEETGAWVPSSAALKEAQAVIRAHREEAGQQALF